ncbi:MAG: YkgJ family cysteine cluster protein [Myxococcota bacterium]
MPTTRSKTRRKKTASRRKQPAPAPVTTTPSEPPRPSWLDEVLATTTTGQLPPVSYPGGPSARPDRPPVPPRPGFGEQLTMNLVGRPSVRLELYREPPVQEGGAEIDMCAGCDVDCCSGHVIPVNMFDAWRLRSVLNIPFSEFLGLVPYQGTAPTHYVRIGLQKFALVLKRRPDRSCAFLLRVGSQRRCGVHALRPDACRIFPFLPDAEMQRTQAGNAMVQMHPSHCPWRWPETPEHKARVLQDIADNQEHRKLDRDVLSMWFWAIGVPKTPDDFFAFLEEELPRRMLRPHEPSKYVTSLW